MNEKYYEFFEYIPDDDDYDQVIVDEDKLEKLNQDIIKSKYNVDIKFDSSYNDAIYKRYYDPVDYYTNPSIPYILYEAASGLSQLDRFFEYSIRYYNWYMSAHEEYVNEALNKTMQFAEIEPVLTYQLDLDRHLLHRYSLESIIMILYSFYERTLLLLIIDVENKAKIDLQSYLKTDHTKSPMDLKYYNYLYQVVGVKVDIRVYKDELNILRRIRNCLIHNSGRCNEKLLGDLLKCYPDLIDDKDIVLNTDYVRKAFSIVGNIFKRIESAFTGKKPSKRDPFLDDA